MMIHICFADKEKGLKLQSWLRVLELTHGRVRNQTQETTPETHIFNPSLFTFNINASFLLKV